MTTHRVFVYGSLLSGLGNHRWLRGATMLGEATFGGGRLVDLGAFPGMVSGRPQQLVQGEVWEVSEAILRGLDQLEGHPRFYAREEVAVVVGLDLEPVRAWAYFLREIPAGAGAVPGGDWRAHWEARCP